MMTAQDVIDRLRNAHQHDERAMPHLLREEFSCIEAELAAETASAPVKTLRPEAKGKASGWTPRQAIMHALTRLGDDTAPVTRVLIVIGHIDDEDESETSMICATKNAYETMGMLVTAMKSQNV